MRMERVTLTLTPEQRQQLRDLADRHQLSISALVRLGVQAILKDGPLFLGSVRTKKRNGAH